ncbi:MAG: sulfatase-like hydrolase/transferase [Armatimonadota bacterium]|nr:sulfatase-like hydrolase/transferase [Armatimonadota bacterium]
MMRKRFILHPFLFAIAPILTLYGSNASQMSLTELIAPIGVTLTLVILLQEFLYLTYVDRLKAGIASSCFWTLFFTYGHLVNILRSFHLIHLSEPETGIFVLMVSLLIAILVLLSRTRANLRRVSYFFNITAIFLVAYSTVDIGAYEIARSRYVGGSNIDGLSSGAPLQSKDISKFPDIYYIILDGYAGDEILRKYYKHDNSDFTRFLKAKGFYVAHNGRSNYCQTCLSLSSSLNCAYLTDLTRQIGTKLNDRKPLEWLIEESRVAHILKQYGYKTVAFESGYESTELSNADVYSRRSVSLTEFQHGILSLTPAPRVLSCFCALFGGTSWLDQYGLSRKRVDYAFDQLPKASRLKEPVFVFAHIVAPHPPFIFGRNGEAVKQTRPYGMFDGSNFLNCGGTREEYVKGYRDQLVYVNKRMKMVLSEILSESGRPKVILLQADHGPGSMLDWENPSRSNVGERMSILQAYYFPDHDYSLLVKTRPTPVNSFRIVFNHFFQMHYPLLDDRSYFSTWSRPYKLIDVTDKLEAPDSEAILRQRRDHMQLPRR